jgi:drug/metabolite transporter (DMT)-like permease
VFAFKVALTLFLMGTIPLLIRMAGAESFTIGIVRLFWGLGLTLLVFYRRVEFFRLFRPEKAGERLTLVLIGLFFGAHWYTYFESIQRSSATLGILALNTYGIHVTWLGAIFLARKPSLIDWIAVLIAALGVWISLPTQGDARALGGFALGILSGLFYAALPLLHKRIEHVNPSTRGTSQFFFAALLFLPFAPTQDWNLTPRTWLVLSALGIFCTFVAHNLWISITTKVEPRTSGLLYYLAVPITMSLEALLLGRPPTPNQLVGALFIIGGNVLVLLTQRPPAEEAARS